MAELELIIPVDKSTLMFSILTSELVISANRHNSILSTVLQLVSLRVRVDEDREIGYCISKICPF